VPPLPNYPNVLKLELLWNVGADVNVQSRLHFTYSGTAPSNAVCATIASDAYAFAVTDLIPLLGTDNSLEGVSVQDLTTPLSGFGEHLADTAGTRSGEPLPGGTAVLMNIRIPRRYRGGKPRVYWPLGTAADLATPNAWVSGSIAAFLAGCAGFIDGVLTIVESGTTIVTMCSISYYEGFTAVVNPITGRTRDVPKVRTAAIAPDLFDGVAINPRPASQRRRNLQLR
jgi:hypothetical protein